MPKPTHNDAKLLVELAKLYEMQGVGEAAAWVRSDEFVPDFAQFRSKYPRGSVEEIKLHKVLGFYEIVGTLYKHGLVNEDLLFDWLVINAAWERMKGVIKGMQEVDPATGENFEAMAEAALRWAAARANRSR